MNFSTQLPSLLLVLMLTILTAGCSGRRAPSPEVSVKPDSSTEVAQIETGANEGMRVFSGDLPLGETAPEMERYLEPSEPAWQGNVPKDARPPGEDEGLPPELLALLTDLRFDFDSYALSLPAQEQLSRLGLYLLENPQVRLLIEGHCDERGDAAYNLALGEKRALTVREFLAGMRVASTRLMTVSFGEERPLDPGYNEASWAKNRRAHFRLRGR